MRTSKNLELRLRVHKIVRVKAEVWSQLVAENFPNISNREFISIHLVYLVQQRFVHLTNEVFGKSADSVHHRLDNCASTCSASHRTLLASACAHCQLLVSSRGFLNTLLRERNLFNDFSRNSWLFEQSKS